LCSPNIKALEAEYLLVFCLKQFKGYVVLDACMLNTVKFDSSDFTMLDEQNSL